MSRKRPHEIKIRLNDKELDRLNKMVARTNYTREDFLRLMIEGYTVQEVPKDYLLFHMDMARICSMLRYNSLNQSLSDIERSTLIHAADELSSVVSVMSSVYKPYYKERKSRK